MRALLRAAALLSVVVPGAALAQATPAPQLFRVIGPRDEVMIGLTAAELEAIGPASSSTSGVERLARKLADDGQLTAWQYAVGRAPDGTTRLVPAGKVAILRNDALRIESYRPALPVAGPAAPQ